MNVLFPCILFYLLVNNIGTANAQQTTRLTATAFEEKVSRGDSVQVLDVRTPGEYGGGHLKNALLADWADTKEFDRRISFINKNQPVYVYCLSGGRSSAAAKKMRSLGYQVYELDGGINAWKAGNKPLEGNSDEPQMTEAAFDKVTKTNQTVLVDFGATWCPPCKLMEPVLQDLRQQHASNLVILPVDGGKDMTLLKKYNVTTLPVFILFKNGQQVWRKDGICTREELNEAIMKEK